MTLPEKAVEAAARAMCDRVNGVGDFDENIEQRRSGWVAQAQAGFDAILSVIMEPDEAMIEAGAVIALDEMDEPCPDLAAETYQAMIRKLMGNRG